RRPESERDVAAVEDEPVTVDARGQAALDAVQLWPAVDDEPAADASCPDPPQQHGLQLMDEVDKLDITGARQQDVCIDEVRLLHVVRELESEPKLAEMRAAVESR